MIKAFQQTKVGQLEKFRFHYDVEEYHSLNRYFFMLSYNNYDYKKCLAAPFISCLESLVNKEVYISGVTVFKFQSQVQRDISNRDWASRYNICSRFYHDYSQHIYVRRTRARISLKI